jgi:hypothetical protein
MLAPHAAQGYQLENQFMSIEVEESEGDFNVASITPAGTDINLVPGGLYPNFLWGVHFVNATSNFSIYSRASSSDMWCDDSTEGVLLLHWDNIVAHPSTVNVTLAITLESTSPLAQWDLTIDNNNPAAELSIWYFDLQLPGITCQPDDAILTPVGFGALVQNPNVTVNGSMYFGYPSSSATMQFMTAGGGAASLGMGIYFG